MKVYQEKLKRSFKSFNSSFNEGRKERSALEKKAQDERPGYALGGNIVSNVIAAPLVAAKGLTGAMRLGGAQGIGRAASESDNAEDALVKIAEGVGTGAIGYGIGKGIEKGIEVAKPTVSKLANRASDFLSEKSKAAFIKLGNALTGESEKNIKTFIEKNNEVNKIIAESGGDISTAADTMREELSTQIRAYRATQGQRIGEALDKVSPEKNIQVSKIIDSLNKIKSRINIKLNPEDAGQIDDVISRVTGVADDAGNASLKEIHQIQEFLSDRAKGSYLKNGQIFVPGKTSQQAAKAGAREAKAIIDLEAPAIKDANSKLFDLHRLEDTINKNLIASGKSEAALLSAGSATSGRNRVNLEKLGNILGKDVVGKAENLSAAAAFGNPNWMPKSSSGTTSTSRSLIAGGIGSLFGGQVGFAAGAAATSPAVLKQAIQTGLISKDVINKIMGKSVALTDQGIGEVVKYLNTPNGQAIFNQVLNQQKVADVPIEKLKVAKGAIQRRLEKISGQQTEE